jgi:hypothetical protein
LFIIPVKTEYFSRKEAEQSNSTTTRRGTEEIPNSTEE